jgi:hypothetical protein
MGGTRWKMDLLASHTGRLAVVAQVSEDGFIGLTIPLLPSRFVENLECRLVSRE